MVHRDTLLQYRRNFDCVLVRTQQLCSLDGTGGLELTLSRCFFLWANVWPLPCYWWRSTTYPLVSKIFAVLTACFLTGISQIPYFSDKDLARFLVGNTLRKSFECEDRGLKLLTLGAQSYSHISPRCDTHFSNLDLISIYILRVGCTPGAAGYEPTVVGDTTDKQIPQRTRAKHQQLQQSHRYDKRRSEQLSARQPLIGPCAEEHYQGEEDIEHDAYAAVPGRNTCDEVKY